MNNERDREPVNIPRGDIDDLIFGDDGGQPSDR